MSAGRTLATSTSNVGSRSCGRRLEVGTFLRRIGGSRSGLERSLPYSIAPVSKTGEIAVGTSRMNCQMPLRIEDNSALAQKGEARATEVRLGKQTVIYQERHAVTSGVMVKRTFVGCGS